MTHKQIVYGKRSLQAMQLREQGETFAMIGEIFKVSTNDARKLVGRGRTMQRRAQTGMEVVTRELKALKGPDKDGWVRNSVTGAGVRYRTWTPERADAVVDAVMAGSPKDDGVGEDRETRRRCAGRGDRLKAGLQASAATMFEVPRAFWPRKGAKD